MDVGRSVGNILKFYTKSSLSILQWRTDLRKISRCDHGLQRTLADKRVQGGLPLLDLRVMGKAEVHDQISQTGRNRCLFRAGKHGVSPF